VSEGSRLSCLYELRTKKEQIAMKTIPILIILMVIAGFLMFLAMTFHWGCAGLIAGVLFFLWGALMTKLKLEDML